jgi:hypothetical protein
VQRLSRRLVASGIVLLATLTTGVGVAAAGTAGVRTLDDEGAILQPVADGLIRPFGSVQGCQVLLDTGTGDCAVVQTAHGALVVTVEPGPYPDDVLASRPWTVRVYRPVPGDDEQFQVALETPVGADGAGPSYANVTAEVADITGDGADELLLGYRSEGTGQILDVDIVDTARDGSARVVAHDELYKGTVVVHTGRLVTYAPVYKKSDANCCPTWIQRSTVRFRDGAFEVTPGARTPTAQADVPAGDLG